MQLLVSVTDAEEARDALKGGADIIDAKDPERGPLGPVTPDALRGIQTSVGESRPISAAIGDAVDEGSLLRLVRDFATARIRFVKVGFAGHSALTQVERLLRSAVAEAERVHPETGVVAVAYADASDSEGHLPVPAIIEAATHVGAAGLLVDTIDKNGPGLTTLVDPAVVRAWVARAHASGLFAALAGRLDPADLDLVASSGADIAGVRGAACEGGRMGRVSASRVHALRGLLKPTVVPNRI